MNYKKKVTINEIAVAVGVSKTTVSRYLNGRYDLMSKKTAERLKTVIELLDYQPSVFARGLKKNESRMIGVVIDDIETPFSSSVIYGCSNYLRDTDYMPLFFNSNINLQNEIDIIKQLIAKGIDGLIVNSASYENKFLVETSSQGLPIVLCDRHIKDYNLDIVTTESDDVILQLVRHLKEQGFTRPVLFTQRWGNNAARMVRIESYRKAMQQEYGYYDEKDIFVIEVRSPSSAGVVVKEFLATLKQSDIPAIIGINTMTTWSVFYALQRGGVQIPAEVGVCGPDDWDWEENISWNNMLNPRVTTIKIRAKEIGRQCARLILERLENPDGEMQEVRIPCSLSAKESTRRI